MDWQGESLCLGANEDEASENPSGLAATILRAAFRSRIYVSNRETYPALTKALQKGGVHIRRISNRPFAPRCMNSRVAGQIGCSPAKHECLRSKNALRFNYRKTIDEVATIGPQQYTLFDHLSGSVVACDCRFDARRDEFIRKNFCPLYWEHRPILRLHSTINNTVGRLHGVRGLFYK